MANTITSPAAGAVVGNGSASSAKRAYLVNVILRGGYFARVPKDKVADLLEESEIIAVEG